MRIFSSVGNLRRVTRLVLQIRARAVSPAKREPAGAPAGLVYRLLGELNLKCIA
jgi:hypothetical protein